MRVFALIVVAVLLAGCSTTTSKGGWRADRYPGSRELPAAVDLMRNGNTAAAKKLLTAICNAPATAGVTDEALFRLALISLKTDSDREGSAYRLLRRLKREFPVSPWTAQAQPLLEFIGGVDETRRQNRSLRGANQGLTRENEELKKGVEQMKKSSDQMKQNIEQMKHLDLELEKQNR